MSNAIEYSDVYTIAPHHRFQWEEAQQCYVILFPEGMVKLNGGAGEVLKRVNGSASVAEIVADIQATFPDVPNIEADIMGMFELALSKQWLVKR